MGDCHPTHRPLGTKKHKMEQCSSEKQVEVKTGEDDEGDGDIGRGDR
jgi:hypothetical protein